MPGSRRCASNCRCGKHQRGGAWNPFKHAKRDFRNVGRALKTIISNPIAKQIIGTVARQGIGAYAPGASAIGDSLLRQGGFGRPSLRPGGGRRSKRSRR